VRLDGVGSATGDGGWRTPLDSLSGPPDRGATRAGWVAVVLLALGGLGEQAILHPPLIQRSLEHPAAQGVLLVVVATIVASLWRWARSWSERRASAIAIVSTGAIGFLANVLLPAAGVWAGPPSTGHVRCSRS
jgi:hypothetical protein